MSTLEIMSKTMPDCPLHDITLVTSKMEDEVPWKVTLSRFTRYTTPTLRMCTPGRNTSVTVLELKYSPVLFAISVTVWQPSWGQGDSGVSFT